MRMVLVDDKKNMCRYERLVELDTMFNNLLVLYVLKREMVDDRVAVISFRVAGKVVTFTEEDFT